jgi:hypothetical protein
MDRERAKNLLPVITAFAQGADVEEKRADSRPFLDGAIWHFTDQPQFENKIFEFRLVRKPREFFFNLRTGYFFREKPVCGEHIIKVREVLDE